MVVNPDVSQTVLLVFPEPDEEMMSALRRAGFHTVTADCGETGLREICQSRPDAVILADDLPHSGERPFHKQVRDMCHLPIIVLGDGDAMERATVIDDGADFYLDHPANHTELIARLRSLLWRYHTSSFGPRSISAPATDTPTRARPG